MNPNYAASVQNQSPVSIRQNYHINPAESKIVYKSPNNMKQIQITKTSPTIIPQYLIRQYPGQVVNNQYQVQSIPLNAQNVKNVSGNNTVNYQARSYSQSPNVGRNQVVPSFQNNMIFTFQPIIHDPKYNNMMPSQVNPQRPQSNITQPVPQSFYNQPLNQKQIIHSIPQPISNNPNQVTFSYQKQEFQSPPIYRQIQNPQIINPSSKSINQNRVALHQNSVIHINLNETNKSQSINQNPLTIVGSPNYQTSKLPPQHITQTYPHPVQKQQNSQFHLTNSVEYSHPAINNPALMNNSRQAQISFQPLSEQTSNVPLPPILSHQPTGQFVIQNLTNSTKSKIANNIQTGNQNRRVNQQEINPVSNPIWEQRFIMIYQKFEWFYERYDFISRQFTILSQQFENVNSQDEWLQLKEKHDLLLQKIQQIQEQLSNTINENHQLAEQYDLENRNSKQSDEGQRVWEHRYHQLLQQYKLLSQNYADLQSQGNNNMNTSQSQHSHAKGGMTLQQQADLQTKFKQLEHQYNILCDQYQKIRIQYERVYQENVQHGRQNEDAVATLDKQKDMTNQLQAYVEQLQQENDHLRKQERKSSPSVDPNSIPREEVQKMQYQFNEQIQKYHQQLQKYQMRFQQFQEQQQSYKQQLQKISEIAMQRQNKIKDLEASQFVQNVNSKSGHSNNQNGTEDSPEWEKTYINRLEHQIKESKEKQKQLLHKLEIKDLQRRSLEQKIHYLERQYQIKKDQIDKLGKNLDQKLVRIQHYTSSNQTQAQGSRHIVQQEVIRPISNSQYQAQITDLQNQLTQLSNLFNNKMKNFKELQNQVQNYESRIRKQNNEHGTAEIQFHKKLSQIEIDYSKKLAQKEMKITILNSEIQRLQQSVKQSNKDKSVSKQSWKVQIQQKQRQLIQRFTKQISQTQKRYQDRTKQFSVAQQLISRLEKQIKSKNEELGGLRNFVNEMKKGSQTTNSASKSQLLLVKQELKAKQQLIQRRNEEVSRLKRQKDYKIKQNTQLQNQLEQVNNQLNKRRSQVSSLKRQINDLQMIQADYQTLKGNYNKRVAQISQLRQQSVDIQKLSMINETQRRDLQRTKQESKNKEAQNLKLKDQIYDLQKKISTIKSSNINDYPSITISGSTYKNTTNQGYSGQKRDDSELIQLRELIKRKDSQIAKISQSLQQSQYVLEGKIRQFQIQKSQLSALTRSKQSQVSALNHNISSLQSRLKQSESKRTKVNQEINQLRAKFQEQLRSQSQRHKTYYEKIISRHQQDYRQLKQKIRALQQVSNKQQIDLQKSRSNQKQLQIQIKQLNKKLEVRQIQQLEKEELFSAFRQKQSQSQQSVKGVYEKLSSVELQLKTKEQQLKLSQQKNSILQQKIKKNKKDNQNFRTKLIVSQQYENNNSVVEYLSKRIAEYESKMINQSQHDFGFKVKDNQANHVFENQVVYQLKMQNQILRKQLEGKGIQYDRKVLNQLEEQNLKRSKNLLKNSAFSSKLGNLSSQFMKDNIEDINFYKQKNKQLEERVEKHLQVNKKLKDRIETLIKNGSQSKQLQFCKQEIKILESKVVQLQKKNEALSEENKNFSRSMSKRQSRVEDHYEERVKELETKVNQLSKTINELTQAKSQVQIAKSQLEMQKKMMSDQIQRLNEKISTFTNAKHGRHQQQAKQLRQKCQQYESEITKLSNRCRVLESQIQRLNQLNNSNKLTLNEVGNIKQKINELTQQLAKSQNYLHQQQLNTSALASQVASWQQKCKFFENQIQRLKEINELYAKKQKSDLTQSAVLKQSTSSTQIQLSSLQNQISMLNSLKMQNQQRIQQFQAQIQYLEGQAQHLQNENQQLQGQLQYNARQMESLHYVLQFLRSGVLEEEALLEQIMLGGENVESAINALKINVERSLYFLQQTFKKLKSI